MEKMDIIVLGGFGALLAFGTLLTQFVKDEIVRGLVMGFAYFLLIALIVLTEKFSSFEASKYPHLRARFRNVETGAAYERHLFFFTPQPIGEGDLDPKGEFKFGCMLPLAQPIRLWYPFGKVTTLFVLLRRPIEENFNFVHTSENVANWKGILVEHRGSDACEIYIDPQPLEIETKAYPVGLLDRTGVDALAYGKNFAYYHTLFEQVERDKGKQPVAPVVTAKTRATKKIDKL